VYVIELVDERVRWIHHRRIHADWRVHADQRFRGRR
jgi:hypothetical protein